MIKKVSYTQDEVLRAYFTWSQMQGARREKEWNIYCDYRDGMPIGFNQDRVDGLHRIDRTLEVEKAKNLLRKLMEEA